MKSDWKMVLIGVNDTISKAIEVIDKSTLRIALVVDDNRKLLGVVTDGDIRRAVLKYQPIDSTVDTIMNTNPKVATINEDNKVILAVMQQHKLLQIPIVGEDKCVIGLETLHDLSKRERNENPVFLMAGGKGTRLRPLTNNLPKPLIKVGDVPILESIIHQFIESGFYRFYISVCYKAEMIMDHFGDGSRWGVEINYVKEDKPLGTAGALSLLPVLESDLPLILMNGDLLTHVNFQHLLNFHDQHEEQATMCVRKYEHQVPYGVIEPKGMLINKIVEKPKQSYLVNAGIYVLDPVVYKSIPKGERIDITTLLENEMDKGKNVSLFPLHEAWIDIGQKDDLNRARKLMSDK